MIYYGKCPHGLAIVCGRKVLDKFTQPTGQGGLSTSDRSKEELRVEFLNDKKSWKGSFEATKTILKIIKQITQRLRFIFEIKYKPGHLNLLLITTRYDIQWKLQFWSNLQTKGLDKDIQSGVVFLSALSIKNTPQIVIRACCLGM